MADPKVVQEVQCWACETEVKITTDDIRFPGSATYTTTCPDPLCGATVEWTDEGDDG